VETSRTHATVGYLVWRLSMKWRAAVDAAVAPLGLTHAQYSVLASLRGLTRSGQPPSQRELAGHTGLDPIYISKLARALEREGLITRVPDGHDARAVRLAVTDDGRTVIDQAIAIVHALLNQLTAPLGGTDGAPVQSLMDDLAVLIDTPLPPQLPHVSAGNDPTQPENDQTQARTEARKEYQP
jgi:MarR family transcriptional regulator, organic hydroperoxide resistance regulator